MLNDMFTSHSKVLILSLRVDRWGVLKMMDKFSERNWKLNSLSKLIFKIYEAGSYDRAKINTLSSDLNMFVKHIMNDVTKNYIFFTKNI